MQMNNIRSQLLRYLWQWQENMPQPLRYLGLIEGYLICWALLDQIALLFESTPEVSVWYPPSGLDFTLLLVFGLRFIPALALNTYVHNLIVPGRNLSLVTLTFSNLITTIGYAGACAFLLLKLRINPRLRTLRDIRWFIVVATIVAPLFVATLQTLNLAWNGITPWKGWLIHVLHYWAGEATGIAMLTPLLLILLRQLPWVWAYSEPEPPEEPKLISAKGKRRQLLIEVIFLSAAIWAAYGAKRGPNLDYSYFVFVPMIWIATRHGFERAAATVLFINIGVALLQRAQISGANVFALQFGMMAISLTGLLLGGFATQRMQAEKELRYSADRLEILHELDQAILAAHSLFEIAEVALERILKLIPCQTASMVMFDLQNREFTILAVNPNSLQIEPGSSRLPVAAFGDIEPLIKGEIITVQETLTFTEMPAASAQLLGESVRAYIKLPLMAQQELIGALNLAKDTPGAFQSRLVEFAEQVANTVAIAMQQARLFSQVEQQATEARSLNQISQAINSSLDPQEILQQIVRLTGECFNVDRVLIFSVTAGAVQVLSEWQVSEVISLRDFPTAESVASDLIAPQSSSDVTPPETATDPIQIAQSHDSSMLSVPIFIRDQMFGCIALQTITKRTFTDDEINLLQAVASQAAIALYNAQSYERLEELVRQRTQELEQEKLLSDAANRAKSDFLSNMSHELRTPLTGILGFSSILAEQIFGELNAKQQQYVELINTSGKHLLELINDLLDLTKVEAGKEDLVLETIIVEEVARACMALIQERAHRRGLQTSLSIAANVTTCIVDKRRLKQILVNLLSNAVKFTETGSVTLQIEQTETEIKFAVIDTGIGISQEEQATLFQPFQQLDSGLNRKYEGTGLGLALSRRLAQLHGGDITVESEPERGSCFTLHLPIQN